MKKTTVLLLTTLALLTVTSAATDEEQMFRIEFTVYENHTFTYLHTDTVQGTTYLPYNEVDDAERYIFEFYDSDDALITSEEVRVRFSDHSNIYLPGQNRPTNQPTKTSTYIQVPLVPNAEQLHITHNGNTLTTHNLVNNICTAAPDGTCNPYCAAHNADPDCESDTGGNTLLLILATLIVVILIVGGIVWYRRKGGSSRRPEVRRPPARILA